MKKVLLHSLAALSLLGATKAGAQMVYSRAQKFSSVGGSAVNNQYNDFIDRFTITGSAGVSGEKLYSSSADVSGAWGRALDSTWINVPLVAVIDSLGCPGTITNGAALNGKWAVIHRGTCQFSEKAYAAQQFGAQGVVIVNNRANVGPEGMGAGNNGASVHIPVIMISKEDGSPIYRELRNGGSVTLTISTWGTRKTHDVALFPTGGSLYGYSVIPFNQLGNNNGNPEPYKIINGGYMANFGTSAETAVKMVGKAIFTPNSGAPVTVVADSVTIPTFTVADSVYVAYSPSKTDFHAGQEGRLDMQYTVSTNDQAPVTSTYSSYVSDSVFSRSRYDIVAKRPISNASARFADGSGNLQDPDTWGTMYHFAKGGDVLNRVQVVFRNRDTFRTLDQLSTDIYVFKWVDGSNGGNVDSIITQGELSPVGHGARTFTTDDTSGNAFYINITDNANPNMKMMTEDNADYFVAVTASGTLGWGIDGIINYLPRFSFSRMLLPGNFPDYYAPYPSTDIGNIISQLDPTAGVSGVALEPYFRGDSARYSVQKEGYVPSMALYMKRLGSAVQEVSNAVKGSVNIFPNPTVGDLNVAVELESASNVYYSVVDGYGRLVTSVSHQNVKSEKFTMPTAALPAGTYYFSASTPNGTIVSKSFTILRK